jgi:acetolactate synthase-1/2/3 large subunit
MLGSLSKDAYRPSSPDAVFATVARAASEAMTCPRGPVCVEIPIDFQYAAASATKEPVPAVSRAVAGEGADISRAAEVLARCRRPLVWAGGGAVAAEAAEEVSALVRRLGAGLLTSPNGRGLLAEDDPLCIGNLSWDPDVGTLCAEADVLVAIGTRFQGPNTQNWEMALPARLIHIDLDPSVPGRNYPVEVAIVGDARLSTAALGDTLGRSGASGVLAETGWSERVRSVAASARERLRATLGSQVGLLDFMQACLDSRTVVVKDSTIPAYTWGNRLLEVRRPRTSIMPNSFAIGLGLPHALGAAVACEGRPVVLLVGDGGFMVSAPELATVAQEGLAIVIIVFVDGGYGVVGNIQRRQYGGDTGRIGVELGRPDFCTLAGAFGIAAERVTTIEAYARALSAAVGAQRPFLLEVDLDSIGPMTIAYTGTSRPAVGAAAPGLRF